MTDMMGNPQQLNPEVLQKERELFSKIKENYRTIQQRTNIINESQLESLNLNLKGSHKFFTPENLISRNLKGIDQLYALVVNMKKELSEKVPEDNLAYNFLSNQGITLSKTEKEIADLKNYVQTRYDLTTDMKKISLTEKFFFADHERFFQNIQTMSLRKVINETVQNSGKIKKDKKLINLSFYQKMIGLQYEEMKKFENNVKRIDDTFVDEYGYLPGHNGSKPGFITERKGYESINLPISGQTPRSFTPMKNKNFSSNTLGIRTSNMTYYKPNDSTNVSSLILNNLRKSRNVLNLNQNESIIQLFDTYYESMKYYFYFKTKGEMVTNISNFSFSQSEVSKFNSSTNKANLYPLTYTIQNLINYFSGLSKDNSRKNFFDLLLHQVSPPKYSSKNPMELTVNDILINTTNYYEQDFLKKVLNLSSETFELNYLKEIDYNSKLRAIENYVNSIIYGKLITSSKDRNIEELGKLKLWGMIYYLIRSGLEEECLRFLSECSINYDDIEISNFQTIYNQIAKKLPIDFELYASMMEGLKSKHESELNPFRHCCFVLVTKVSQTVNDNILENLEDYIWFHLKLIIDNENYKKLREDNIFNAKFFTLKEFQDYIKRYAPENFESGSNEMNIDYAKCLFSILLFEDGLKSLGQHDENLVDTVNISFILKEIGLLRNFHSNENKNIFEISYLADENNYITNRWVETFAETFMNARMFPIMNYLKYLYKGNLLEKISNIINSTGKYNSLLTPEDLFFNISIDKKINLIDLLGEIGVSNLVSYVVRDAIDNSADNKANYEIVIQLAKKFSMHNELLELIINDSVEILTMKTPKKIYKPQIHLRANLVNKIYTDTRYDVKMSEKYKSILEDIGANIMNYDNSFKINFIYLRQLENIEEIYELINKNMENKAWTVFDKCVTLIPYKSERDIAQFLNHDYVYIKDLLKNIYPDVINYNIMFI